MQPDTQNDDQPIQPLPEDNETPFTPADPSRDDSEEPDSDGQPATDLDDTHPATDSEMDSTELYNEGVAGAAEVDDPTAVSGDVDSDDSEIADDEKAL